MEVNWRSEVVKPDWSRPYADHAAALAGFLTKLTGDREVAMELMQETFVRAIRAGQDPAEVRSVRAWLFLVASNLARDHHRRRAVLRFMSFSGRELDPSVIHDPDTELVHRALGSLPIAQAAALLLHYDAGFSRKEIAQMEQISEEAVKSRLARGREAFRRAFERSGGHLS